MEPSERSGKRPPQRSSSRRRVGVAAAALVVAWIAWAIYVAADRGGREALGVLIAWPLIVVAVALISLVCFWVVHLVRSHTKDPQASDEAEATTSG